MYDQIISLARKNGQLLKEKAGLIEDIGVKKKYLTELDLQIERDFENLISKLTGEHSIFAEEEHDSFQDSENVWIIDPISSTYNFIHGLPHYAIALTHVLKGESVFSLVYDPSMDEMFTAEIGKGAFLNGEKIEVNRGLRDGCIMYEFSSTIISKEKGAKLLGELSEFRYVKKSLGSLGIHYCYVACGRASAAVSVNKDAFPEFAGKLILEEAGGRVSDFLGNEIDLNSVGVVFSDGEVHEEVLGIIQRSNIEFLR